MSHASTEHHAETQRAWRVLVINKGLEAALLESLADDDLGKSLDAEPRLREAVTAEIDRPDFLTGAGWVLEHDLQFIPSPVEAAPSHALGLIRHLLQRFCPSGVGEIAELLTDAARKLEDRTAEWRRQASATVRDPWSSFDAVRAVKMLSVVLWKARVRAEVERTHSSAPALVIPVSRAFPRIWNRTANIREAVQGALELFDGGGTVATMPANEAIKFLGARTSLTFHRLLRWLAQRGFELRPGQADLHVEGGYQGLADQLCLRGKSAASEVRDALAFGHSMRRAWIDGSEALGLWLVTHRAPARGRRGHLIITLAPMLRPGFVHTLPKADTPSRLLVPVPPLVRFVGRDRDHAAQAGFQWATTIALTERRAEIANCGGATITDAEWQRLAEGAGVPLSTWRSVRGSWEGAFLENVGADRWHVADVDPFRPTRRFLNETANRTILGRHRRRQGR